MVNESGIQKRKMKMGKHRKLEETFNIAPTDINDIENPIEEDDTPTVEESTDMMEIIQTSLAETDKIDNALPAVRDLDEHDKDMDEIHKRALSKFDEVFDLGMNVEVHAGAKLLETANQLLKTAMEAKDSKVDRKLRMINLQMQKARLDEQIRKEDNRMAKDNNEEIETEGSITVDRNELLKRLQKAEEMTKTDK